MEEQEIRSVQFPTIRTDYVVLEEGFEFKDGSIAKKKKRREILLAHKLQFILRLG